MAGPAPRAQHLANVVPNSVRGVDRRSILRGSMGAAALLGVPTLLSACGDDAAPAASGGAGASAKAGPVSFGINEAKGSGPAYERLQGMADAYAKKTGSAVTVNAVDHNTFQESINTYLQGTPDDVFTWFAGYRMAQFAENGLIRTSATCGPSSGMSDAFKKSATAPDGKQYFVPISYYPWAVFYRKSVFEKNGWTVPTTLDEIDRADEGHAGQEAHPDRLRATRTAGPPMGTFDILNMRLNGYDFHMALMPGQGEVGQPRGQERLHHLDGQAAARTSRRTPSAAPGRRPRRRWPTARAACTCSAPSSWTASPRRPRTTSTSSPSRRSTRRSATTRSTPRSTASASPRPARTRRPAKAYIKWLGTPEAADAGNNAATAPFIAANSGASTATYGDLQKKSVELVSKAKSIAQFLDRDTNADFANTVIIASLQEFLKNPNDIDGITASIQQQATSILG